MNEINFTVYGEPMGKQRPRHTKNGHTYTPQKTADYEQRVQFEYYFKYDAMQFNKDDMLAMEIIAYQGIPKSASKKKQELMRQGAIRPTKKPDWDNIAKIVCDALNETAYPDDRQIVSAELSKYYSHSPRVEIRIKKLKQEK